MTEKIWNFIKKKNNSFYREEFLDDFNTLIFSERREDEEIKDLGFNDNQVSFNDYSQKNKINSFESVSTNFNGIKGPKIFGVVYQKFPNKSNGYITIKYKKRIRTLKPRRRREHQDNIRKRIKRYFFNQIVIDMMNRELRKEGNKNYFELFPSDFVSDVARKRNKKILDMTIIQIMKKKELYKNEYLKNYCHNIKILDSLNEEKNHNLIKILNTKYRDLFDEFLHSDKFQNFVNLLIEENESDVYLGRVKFITENWLKFFSE